MKKIVLLLAVVLAVVPAVLADSTATPTPAPVETDDGITLWILQSGVKVTIPPGYKCTTAEAEKETWEKGNDFWIIFSKEDYQDMSYWITLARSKYYYYLGSGTVHGIELVMYGLKTNMDRTDFGAVSCTFNIGYSSYSIFYRYAGTWEEMKDTFTAIVNSLVIGCAPTATPKPVCKHANVATDAAIPATCTSTGLTEGSHCADCGEVLVAQTEVPAKGHSYNTGKVTQAATCTDAGVKTFTCTDCSDSYTEAIPAMGHSKVTTPAADATCTTPGLSAGEKCERCGLVFVEQQETAPALGHAWDDGVIVTDPTYKEEGSCIYTCTRCHENKTEVLPVLPTPTPFPQVSFGYGEYVQVKDSDVYIQLPKGAEHWDDTCYVPYADMGMYIVFEQFERNATLAAVEDYYEGDDYVTLHPMTVKEIRVIVAEEEFNARVYFESNGDVYLIGQEILYDAEARKLFFRVIGTMKRGVAPTPTPVPTATPLPPPADMRYTVYDDYVEITRYTGSATTLEIPAYIEGKPVKVIGEQAFARLNGLRSVIIPEGVTTIGRFAFEDCYNLTSVSLPDILTTIDVAAFRDCTKLSSIDIPMGVTEIGSWAFAYCENLMRVDVPASVTKVGDNAFAYCSNLERIYFWRNNTFGISTTSIPSDTTIYCYRASKVGAVFTQYGNTVVYLDGTATPTPKPTSAITSTPVPTATPTPTPSPTPTNPPVRLPGDANEDGEVDIYDALVILRYAAGQEVTICLYNADVNDDDQADILDAILILQQGAGWNVELL